jgi:hypothetical protein
MEGGVGSVAEKSRKGLARGLGSRKSISRTGGS